MTPLAEHAARGNVRRLGRGAHDPQDAARYHHHTRTHNQPHREKFVYDMAVFSVLLTGGPCGGKTTAVAELAPLQHLFSVVCVAVMLLLVVVFSRVGGVGRGGG